MADLTQYLVDLETQRPNPFDNTKVLRGDAPRTAFTKINDLIMALVGVVNHFGPEAPSPTYPFMRWNDTRFDPPKEMYRNAENTAWLEVPPVLLTALQVKELYESNSDTNAFTDADIAALANKVDKVPGKDLSDNNFTNAERDKLAGLEGSRYKGLFVSIEALNAALPTGAPGDYADVDAGVGADVMRYIWDDSDSKWSAQAGTADPITAAQVKVLYESNANTNAFTDALLEKLNGIEAGATKLPAAVNGKILRGVGTTWVAGDEITYSPATSGSNGLMTAEQFNKLAGIAAGATANRPDSQTPAFPGNVDGKVYGLSGNQLVEIIQGKDWTADINALNATTSSNTSRITALEGKIAFKYAYPNGGTAQSPANVSINSRYEVDNPYPGKPIFVEAEILFGGVWSKPGFVYASTGGYGVSAGPISDTKIGVQVGSNAVSAPANHGGNPNGAVTASITTPTPCRLKVWQMGSYS